MVLLGLLDSVFFRCMFRFFSVLCVGVLLGSIVVMMLGLWCWLKVCLKV